jgi:hypothetical protein
LAPGYRLLAAGWWLSPLTDDTSSHVLIGWDGQGRCLAVPSLPTDDPATWQAVTAWRGKPGEAAKLGYWSA